MGVADQIEAELPFLRRYARAVSGSSDRGDALVEQVIERLIDTGVTETDRITLFGLLDQEIVQLAEQNGSDESALLLSGSRRALLLTSMEGFAPDDAARIMNIGPDELAACIALAESELQTSLATDVFVIEDEPIVAAHIVQIATQMGHNVIGQAVTRDDAIEACLARPPRLLLADVQLADGSSGADAAHVICQSHDIPVVFITAYPQRLLMGVEGEPAYLIAKPFRPDMVKAVISQALMHQAARASSKK